MTLLSCHACAAPGIRNLGKDGYCGTHLAVLYRTFNPLVFADGGVGLPSGRQHPEYGPGIEDLTCCRCEATWAGTPGDPCWWCQRAHEIMADYQADLVRRPPDVDPEDLHYEARMDAWADRLVVGVRAGVISAEQAEQAWHRALRIRRAA